MWFLFGTPKKKNSKGTRSHTRALIFFYIHTYFCLRKLRYIFLLVREMIIRGERRWRVLEMVVGVCLAMLGQVGESLCVNTM